MAEFFKDIPIGSKFRAIDYGTIVMKLSDTSEYFNNYPLQERPTNCIILEDINGNSINRQTVCGNEVLCEIIN
ncbi:MAG: hypothetical protein VZS44_09735 [Bacilli bacterium]|nr:hypothetical protein [Bacilli bacterium]